MVYSPIFFALSRFLILKCRLFIEFSFFTQILLLIISVKAADGNAVQDGAEERAIEGTARPVLRSSLLCIGCLLALGCYILPPTS